MAGQVDRAATSGHGAALEDGGTPAEHLDGEYSSGKAPMSAAELVETLRRRKLMLDQVTADGQELLA